MKEKEIKIWYNRLELSKYPDGTYLVNDTKADLFIHASEAKLTKQMLSEPTWLSFYMEGKLVGSLWIYTKTDIQKIKQFLEETKSE